MGTVGPGGALLRLPRSRSQSPRAALTRGLTQGVAHLASILWHPFVLPNFPFPILTDAIPLTVSHRQDPCPLRNEQTG